MPENNYPMPFLDHKAFIAMVEEMLKVTVTFDTSALLQSITDMIDITNQISGSLKGITVPIMPPIDVSSMMNAVKIAAQIPWASNIAQITKSFQTINDVNRQIILCAMESAAPHLEEEQRKTCEEEIIPKLKDPKKPMTRSDWLSIIGILIPLIFSLLSLRPDPQVQRQIEQQDQLIAISEEQLEIDKDQNDLLNQTIDMYALALNDAMQRLDQLEEEVEALNQLAGASEVPLTDSANHFTEDIDVFADNAEPGVNAIDPKNQDETANAQERNHDFQQ